MLSAKVSPAPMSVLESAGEELAPAPASERRSSLEAQLSWMASHTADTQETGDTSDDHPFPKNLVGFYSNHGIRPGNHEDTFQIKTNQDRAAVTFIPGAGLSLDDAPTGDSGNDSSLLLQVYDGHGTGGEEVSEFAARTLLDVLHEDE